MRNLPSGILYVKIESNKTRQGYVCKHTLKQAGYSFLGEMCKRPFTKPATTLAQQVALLQSRGMTVSNISEAEFYLQHLGYYRLAAYWLPFETDHETHEFQTGTKFSDVLNFYAFDRELRLLVLDSIERIEVSVRSQWAYHLGHAYGSHAHLNSEIFDSFWQKNVNKLTQEVNRSEEAFIRHMKNTYSETLPAVWAVCEVISLGLLSRWYGSLRPRKERSLISSSYLVDEGILQSWLQHLSIVRNICAHHSRLWNRDFTVTPKIPKTKPSVLKGELIQNSRKIYNTLVILAYLMDQISPNHSWRSRIKHLINLYVIPVRMMGFPANWDQKSIWQ